MSADIRKYKGAEHVFAIEMDACSALWENIGKSYGPFQVNAHHDSDIMITHRQSSASMCDHVVKL